MLSEDTSSFWPLRAAAVAVAGAFSVVLKKVPEQLALRIPSEITIPTIGIGASPACDGQILVIDDLLGMFMSFRPNCLDASPDAIHGSNRHCLSHPDRRRISSAASGAPTVVPITP